MILSRGCSTRGELGAGMLNRGTQAQESESAGLIARRHREATLWRSGFAALQLD